MNVAVLGLGTVALLVACDRQPDPDLSKDASSSASAVERPCHLVSSSPKQRFVRLELESGVIVQVLSTTACVVLDERRPRALVRITDGTHQGMTGWVPADKITR